MNRREVLAGGAGAAVSGVSGCLSILPGVQDVDGAYPWWKAINGTWEYRGTRYELTVLNARFDDEEAVFGEVASEVEVIVDPVTEIRVDDSLADALRAFDEVSYVVGFCWDEHGEETCSNPSVSREVFNSVQFGDLVDLRFSGSDVDLRTVNAGAGTAPTDRDGLLAFEFADRHSDRNPPEL